MSEFKGPSADEILALDDRPVFPVEVPQWGLTGEKAAQVRELDAYEIAVISKSTRDDAGNRDQSEFVARVIMSGCVYPKFEPRHLEALKHRSAAAIEALFGAIMAGKKSIPSMS